MELSPFDCAPLLVHHIVKENLTQIRKNKQIIASFFLLFSAGQREIEIRRFCGVPIFAIVGAITLSVLLALFLCAAYAHDKG